MHEDIETCTIAERNLIAVQSIEVHWRPNNTLLLSSRSFLTKARRMGNFPGTHRTRVENIVASYDKIDDLLLLFAQSRLQTGRVD